jgi:hypothetical protein
VAVVTLRRWATSWIERSRSVSIGTDLSRGRGAWLDCNTGVTKFLVLPAKGWDWWSASPDPGAMVVWVCEPLLPAALPAPPLPKLNVVGSNPISRFAGIRAAGDGPALSRHLRAFLRTGALRSGALVASKDHVQKDELARERIVTIAAGEQDRRSVRVGPAVARARGDLHRDATRPRRPGSRRNHSTESSARKSRRRPRRRLFARAA